MIRKMTLALLVIVAAHTSLHAQEWKSLFNGKDLTGWDGTPGMWRVEDGALTGETTAENPLKYNQFLIYKGGEPANFEFKCQFKLRNHNSGVQYRSHENPSAGPFSVGGYQADMDETNKYTGMCYEERGRGIFSKRGERTWIMPDGTKLVQPIGNPDELAKSIKAGDWNSYEIIANGNHVIQKINGVLMTEFFDHQADKRALKGIIAFQMHAGPPMKVQFKDIMLKELPEGGILSPEQAAPPADAKKEVPPAPKKKGEKKAEKKTSAAPAANGEAVAAKGGQQLPFDQGLTPKWVWAEKTTGNQTIWVRKVVQLADAPKSATLYVTCDNGAKIFINGKHAVTNKDWMQPSTVDVTKLLVRGDNLIAVEATNKGGSAGLLAKLVVNAGAQQPVQFVTDASWLVSMKEPGKGWDSDAKFTSAEFKPAKVEKPYGESPWGAVFAAGKPGGKRGGDSGPAYNGPPVPSMTVAKDFKAELLYSVPKETQGSWVGMTFDPKGRVIVSDQSGILYRITLDTPEKGKVQVQPLEITFTSPDGKKSEHLGGAHGLCWAFDSLYVMVSDGKVPKGLYRCFSSDGGETFNKVVQVREIKGGGEHGPHAVIPTPDGKGLYIIAGNHTDLTAFNSTLLPTNWQEDHLLPRMPDANGHAATRMAPGGWIMRIDPDGKEWQVYSVGYRNQFSAASNQLGDLITYDSDMEWDIGLPWYRPTRILFAPPGSDFGWRNGSENPPEWFADSLGTTLNIGPGSPTGMCSGAGSKFPAKYQQAIFACDWSYGVLYAIHLTPNGAGYSAQAEKFITGRPLPLTQVAIGPDGNLYFIVGGRKTQSGLYRVSYAGGEPTAPATMKLDGEAAKLHALRKSLESFYGKPADAAAVDAALPLLGHPDRLIRFTARNVLEQQPVATWQDKALAIKDPEALIYAVIGLARQADKSIEPRLIESLNSISIDSLTAEQQVDLLRAYEMVFTRMGTPGSLGKSVVEKLEPRFPAGSWPLNRELAALLVYVDAPNAVSKLLARMGDEHADAAEQIWYAYCLRVAKVGWTLDQRKQFYGWFDKAAEYKGGHSFVGFIRNIRKESIEGLSASEKQALGDLITKPFESKPLAITPAAGRTFVKMYEMKDLAPLVEGKELTGRNFDRGRAMFSVAACSVCHRIAAEGGTVGPDLTALGTRFSTKDILESIIEPSKVISDQYEQTIFTMEDGSVVVGRIINLGGDSFRVQTNMLDPDSGVGVDRRKIKEMKPSPISPMPPGLLSMLKEDEILDLLAYLKSGGNRDDRMFKK